MSIELENRFQTFAINVRDLCRTIKLHSVDREYVSQVIRSSGSIGANYIEASEHLGKADELMKLKISRREAKESAYWLRLISFDDGTGLEIERLRLVNEAEQLTRILSAIISKRTQSQKTAG
jgi:four helix bundle protein